MKFEIFRNVILDEIKQFNDGKVSFYPEDDTISKLARAWYLGYVPEVHNYKLFNGKKFNTFKKKQLGLYKKSCEDSASMLLNEKCDIVIGDAESQLQFSKLLYNNNFWVKANQGIEVSFALGYGFLVQGVKDLKVTEDGSIINDGKGKYVVDFVNAEKCLPLIVEDDKVTDIAFVKVNTLNTIISIHCKDRRSDSATKGNYFIINIELKNDGLVRKMATSTSSIVSKYVLDTQSDLAWFQPLKPNIANNYQLDNVLGLPLCWNALDILASIDNAYDSLDIEINDSKRKTFVTESLTNRHITEDGETINPFDPNDARFYLIPDELEGKQLIQESAPALRSNDIISALNMQLNTYTSKLGWGENYYNFNGRQLATATQVISENSALFRTLKKHEIIIEQSLRDFAKATIHICNTFTEIKFNNINEDDINIKFDDSIIEDKETEKTSDRTDVTNGTMSNVEYRMKWYAEDEETAFKQVGYLDVAKVLDTLHPSLSNGVMTPKQAVDLLSIKFKYLDVNGLEEYISNELQSQKMTPIDPFADENTNDIIEDELVEEDVVNE